jgi:hypothetical protein
MKTEFYETAVQLGFHGLERGGLRGKKDNVRKYWEDTVVDLWASVMGPLVACELRNLETTLGEGVGCGHSLIVVARVG